MSISRILVFGLLITAMPVKASEPIAIVYSLAGEASYAGVGGARHSLQLFNRLPARTTIEVGPGSRVELAFVNGFRYELGELSRVTLGLQDLISRSGPVRPLPRVSPLPRLAPIAEDDHPGPKAGAVRIRSEEIEGLCPRDGASTLADATILRFQAAGDATRYQVEVEDARGTVAFRTITEAPAVKVPTGILEPGARYHWAVTAVDRPGPMIRGETDFVTLTSRTADARERLRQAVEAAGDADSRALLAAVDHSLGLASERCAGPARRTR